MNPNKPSAEYLHYREVTASPADVYNELLLMILKLQKRVEALEAKK